jgi:hypothetical protein
MHLQPEGHHMLRKIMKFIGYVVGFLVLFPVAILALRLAVGPIKSETAPPSAEDAKKSLEEAQFQLYSATLRKLVASMKNPDSFTLVDAVKMSDGNLCITYRGTNSFNAIATENAVIDSKMVIRTDSKSWNKRCGGKSGERYTHIKYNL